MLLENRERGRGRDTVGVTLEDRRGKHTQSYVLSLWQAEQRNIATRADMTYVAVQLTVQMLR